MLLIFRLGLQKIKKHERVKAKRSVVYTNEKDEGGGDQLPLNKCTNENFKSSGWEGFWVKKYWRVMKGYKGTLYFSHNFSVNCSPKLAIAF